MPSTETADALVQTEVADLSSGSHLLRHSPRCASSTFSTKFPDPHESPISLEKNISAKYSVEIRTTSSGMFFPTGIDQRIPSFFISFFINLTYYSRWTSSLPSCLWSQRIFPSLAGPRLAFFFSRCKFSTLTARQPMVEFYLLTTFPRFP